jgi:hypothetical protein
LRLLRLLRLYGHGGTIVANRFQQLGALVSVSTNLTEWHVSEFQKAGGRWIDILVDQLGGERGGSHKNGESVVYNRLHFQDKQKLCAKYGVACGPWFNAWAENPYEDAKDIAKWVHDYNCGPVMIDDEGDYKSPANAWKRPCLFTQVRKLLPTRSILSTTPGQYDDALIWNGNNTTGNGEVWKSHWKLGIRWAPQWYSPYYNADGHTLPEQCMADLKKLGNQDNYYDPKAPGGRALPLSFCKGMLEVSGLEEARDPNGKPSSLADELTHVESCWKQGLITSPGLSLYLIENINRPGDDFKLIAQERGRLFLV